MGEEPLTVRPLRDEADWPACVDLQRTVCGFADRDLILSPLLAACLRHGGLLLGAFRGARLTEAPCYGLFRGKS